MREAGTGPLYGPRSPLPSEVARGIRLVIFDVDGVLTDGGVYLGTLPEGQAVEFKRFDIQDGLGMKLLESAGVEVAIVSGRVSQATEVRARELGIQECHQDGGAQKVRVIQKMLDDRKMEWHQVAMLADDLPDLAVLRRVGLPATVANATEAARRESLWQGERSGGRGAVREFCEAILKARGDWDEQVEAYVRARDGTGGQRT